MIRGGTMTDLTRRNFTEPRRRLARRLARRCLRRPCSGQAKPKLVVIGGGPGGGTVARYVNKDAAGAIDVTLVEPQQQLHHLLLLQPLCRRLSATSSRSPTATTRCARKASASCTTWRASIDRDKKQVVLAGGAAHSLRPARGRARHRHQVRLRARLFGSRRRRSCRMPGSPARRRSSW